jgi:surface antigen
MNRAAAGSWFVRGSGVLNIKGIAGIGCVIAMALVSGCTPRPKASAAVNPAIAAYAGPRTGNPLLDAMAGGLVAGAIGTGLSMDDRRAALEAEYKALEYTPSGQKVTWQGKSSGLHGEVTAGQPYQVGSQNCRQYSDTVYSGSAAQTAKGTACRNPDGSWTPLS